MKRLTVFLALVFMLALSATAFAGEVAVLDEMYTDKDGDMVADFATDNCKDPSTLVFTYTPVEDPAVYKDAFADFQEYLSNVTGKRVIYYTVQSNAAEVEAMRSGKLHIAGFSTGPTGFAVNLAGYVPIAVKGYPDGFQGYNLVVVTKKDSPIKEMKDLKGKKVAHTSASSNSGNLAPRALFPELGLVPDQDYTVVYSGKHDQSILGVVHGDYDAAPVASDVYDRMIEAGRVDKDALRVIWRSPKFPTSSFGISSQLCPELAQKIIGAFMTYRFPKSMQDSFKGADRFYPITYKVDWKVIRDIADATGTSYNKAGLEAMAAKEAAKKKK
ncbi:Phosphonate transport system substrate-binding protein [Pseudodesulfovibrio profundus]|uniref:Phosphonate transport system substrate-binding protein n=1 Tax=Pseudodesulfovibrio profundus TaxID=57320 RepID=A0A2C8FED8_9BACT|nr:phosphate/phosphite/phosphonate ABC transporter substrate-binding protein [Pseudodesulfovibrio profundus]MBC16971.1 phosphonate ABC transporter substrate-binding protein [Desulfovibrio sp.]SOB60429.1 Phosphonate transport system substrate-binding protein [Pseudodesulfovibrio profundus]